MMKREITIQKLTLSFVLGMALAGCVQSSDLSNELITINVTANYSEKELVLQDFMDVEYIPLQTTDEFVTQGDVAAIGDSVILVKNYINDGNIYVFDRKTGHGLRIINRRGQGAEEYTYINSIVLDEEHEEIFVNDATLKKILVYDLSGNFKRSFNHTKGAEYLEVYNFDTDNLIRYDMSVYYEEGNEKKKDFYHAVISKQDGRIVQGISIPFNEVTAPFIQEGDAVVATSIRSIMPYKDKFMLIETSSDTVYSYAPNENRLIPFIVKKETENPKVFLTMGPVTNQYCFIQTIKKEFDFTTGRGFPTSEWVYDRQAHKVYSAVILNADYTNKQKVNMISNWGVGNIATFEKLEAYKLIEAYEKDELKGTLKDVASLLNEESNPVIMLIKYKDV